MMKLLTVNEQEKLRTNENLKSFTGKVQIDRRVDRYLNNRSVSRIIPYGAQCTSVGYTLNTILGLIVGHESERILSNFHWRAFRSIFLPLAGETHVGATNLSVNVFYFSPEPYTFFTRKRQKKNIRHYTLNFLITLKLIILIFNYVLEYQ